MGGLNEIIKFYINNVIFGVVLIGYNEVTLAIGELESFVIIMCW